MGNFANGSTDRITAFRRSLELKPRVLYIWGHSKELICESFFLHSHAMADVDDKSQAPSIIEGGPSTQEDNKQGTFYQSTADAAIKRKHFFSPLDHSLADAVNKDAADVEYTAEEEVSSMTCFRPNRDLPGDCRNASRGR